MAKRRRARGEWCWEMQVVACGGTCCAPLEDRRHCEGRIEQGHIVPEAEGGDDNPDNLIPLCRKHNRKYRKLRAPDSRPAGWRERYIQLLAHDVQPRFCVPHEKFDSRVIAASSATENTDVIAWPQPDFAAANSLYTSPSAARRAAVTLVERIVDASQKLEPRLFHLGRDRARDCESSRKRILQPSTFWCGNSSLAKTTCSKVGHLYAKSQNDMSGGRWSVSVCRRLPTNRRSGMKTKR